MSPLCCEFIVGIFFLYFFFFFNFVFFFFFSFTMGCFSKTAIFFALLAVYLGWQEYRLLKDASAPDCASLKLGEASSKIQWEKHQDHLIETLKKFAEQRRQGKLDDPDPKHQLKRVQHPVGWGCLNGTLSISTNESNQIGWIKVFGLLCCAGFFILFFCFL